MRAIFLAFLLSVLGQSVQAVAQECDPSDESLTTARTEQLSGYLNCEEGDLSCPVPPAQ